MAVSPSKTKTIEKPETKIKELIKICFIFFESFIRSSAIPVINVIYAGISGSTQGLIKVSRPAKKLAIMGKFPKDSVIFISSLNAIART